PLATVELLHLAVDDPREHVHGNPETFQDVAVGHGDAPACDGAHGELFVPGPPSLRTTKTSSGAPRVYGHLLGNRDASAREPQHHHVRPSGIRGEAAREEP